MLYSFFQTARPQKEPPGHGGAGGNVVRIPGGIAQLAKGGNDGKKRVGDGRRNRTGKVGKKTVL